MACHYPKPAYLSTEGKVTFTRHEKAMGKPGFIWIRCGMCLGCKADHARDWAIRCYHESQYHPDSCFVTLTYSDNKLPPHGTLEPRDLELFWKNLRNKGLRFRYFACGEYGSKKGRPHYHAIIFGVRPTEKTLHSQSAKGNPQYVSKIFSDCWTHGFHTWSEFDPSCARYVAHYTADKLKSFAKDTPDPDTGLRPYEVMDRDGAIWKLQPEFQRQSLKPAIGLNWISDNWSEVFPADSVVMDSKEYPPPRFYYQWLKENQPEIYEIVKRNRKKHAITDDGITGVREYQIAQAKTAKLSRYKRPTHEKG